MDLKQIRQYRKAAEESSLPDSENPLYAFQVFSTGLLVKIVNREFSPALMARYELRCRGLDDLGQYVGFECKDEDMLKPLRRVAPKPDLRRRAGKKRGRSL